jgi:hypothetical protein
MNRIEHKEWNQKAYDGLIEDALNPVFILSGCRLAILSQIAKGEIDCKELAKRELESTGHDISGMWVGFDNEIK